MKTILKSDLRIVSENESEIWAFCPNHRDRKHPNFWITKKNGMGHCFACGFTTHLEWACGRHGKARDLGIEIRPANSQKLSLHNSKKIDIVKTFERMFSSFTPQTNKEIVCLNLGFDIPAEKMHITRNIGAKIGNGSIGFPLWNEKWDMVGIHKRPQKKNVRGSRVGIFGSPDMINTDVFYITEGVTDLICILAMGLRGIGRFSANSCVGIIKSLTSDKKYDRIVIVADNDNEGKRGAERLRHTLSDKKPLILYPPSQCKDLKEWVKRDGLEKVKKIITNLYEAKI